MQNKTFYNGKVKLLALSFMYLLFWLLILFSVFSKPNNYNLISMIAILVLLFISTFAIYKLLVNYVIDKIYKDYSKLSKDIISIDNILISDITKRLEKIDKYVEFYKNIFSEYDLILINNSKDKVIEKQNNRFGGFRNL